MGSNSFSIQFRTSQKLLWANMRYRSPKRRFPCFFINIVTTSTPPCQMPKRYFSNSNFCSNERTVSWTSTSPTKFLSSSTAISLGPRSRKFPAAAVSFQSLHSTKLKDFPEKVLESTGAKQKKCSHSRVTTPDRTF